jgi:hypothetical protein
VELLSWVYFLCVVAMMLSGFSTAMMLSSLLLVWAGAVTHASGAVPCGELVTFHAECLVPVMGLDYGFKSFDIERACETILWATSALERLLPAGPLPRDCKARAEAVIRSDETDLKGCNLEYYTWGAVVDFAKGCADTVGTLPAPLDPEEEAIRLLAPRDVWSRAKKRRASTAAAAGGSPPLSAVAAAAAAAAAQRRADPAGPGGERGLDLLRTASVAEVQQVARDPVHARWTGGPTYTGKLSRQGGAKYPGFGHASIAEEGPLFLRGSMGDCYNGAVARCWGRNEGTYFKYNAGTTGTFETSSGLVLCAAGDPAVPTAGLAVAPTGSCQSPVFTFVPSAIGWAPIQHAATGLCLGPTLALTADCATEWGHYTNLFEPPGYIGGFKRKSNAGECSAGDFSVGSANVMITLVFTVSISFALCHSYRRRLGWRQAQFPPHERGRHLRHLRHLHDRH